MATGRQLIGFSKDGDSYSIRITDHGEERAKQRGVSEDAIVCCVFALTLERLKKARDEQKDLAVIDEKKEVAVIVGMEKNTIQIITVLNKSDIYVKEGTEVRKI